VARCTGTSTRQCGSLGVFRLLFQHRKLFGVTLFRRQYSAAANLLDSQSRRCSSRNLPLSSSPLRFFVHDHLPYDDRQITQAWWRAENIRFPKRSQFSLCSFRPSCFSSLSLKLNCPQVLPRTWSTGGAPMSDTGEEASFISALSVKGAISALKMHV
jgi:hypothetical protein